MIEIATLWLSQLIMYPFTFLGVLIAAPFIAIPWLAIAIIPFIVARRKSELRVFLPAWSAVFVLPTTMICDGFGAITPWVFWVLGSILGWADCFTVTSLVLTLALNFLFAHLVRLGWSNFRRGSRSA